VIFFLDEKLKKYFSGSTPLFDQVMALRGESFRHLEGRLTQRILIGDKSYFIKQHSGVGWREIIKNLSQLRLPVTGARNEWEAISKLNALGVETATVVGYGQRGCNPAKLQSFILMEELQPVISLEELTANWKQNPPDVILKRDLIAEVARMTRIMHSNGINHRDLYICHFLLDTSTDQVKLSLIDLHRAQMRNKIPERWKVKDLAGLYFSSKDIGLTKNDIFRFMKIYSEKSLREIYRTEKKLWNKVKKRGEQLYRDHAK
jgi:heptose I phosphotransferase